MTAPDPKAVAVQLLYENMHALPHKEYGVINVLPFAGDSEQTRMFTRQVCEAIVNLLDGKGLLNLDRPESQPTGSAVVTMKCRNADCASEMLLQAPVDDDGVAFVDAHMLIQQLSALNPQCPHGVLGLEDMRRHMETQFWADEKTQESLAHQNSQERRDR